MTSEKRRSGHLQTAIIVVFLIGIACVPLLDYYSQAPNPLSNMAGPELPTERFGIIRSQAINTTLLALQIANLGTSSITVTGVTLNGTEAQGLGYVSYIGGFVGVTGAERLEGGMSGTICLEFSAVPVSGATYDIIVTTAAGSECPATFTWP